MKRFGLASACLVLILGLAVSGMAAREIVSGTVDRVDAVNGHLVLKTTIGLRLFEVRPPDKLQGLRRGDLIEITIEADGTIEIEKSVARM
jgi:hypothetical protein